MNFLGRVLRRLTLRAIDKALDEINAIRLASSLCLHPPIDSGD